MKALLNTFVIITFLASCTLEDGNEGININEIISFEESTGNSVPADSVTVFVITVVLGDDVSKEQQVTFSTDQGWFEGTGNQENKREIVRTTTLKKVTVNLVPDTKPNKRVVVTATVKDGDKTFTITKDIEFTISYPSELFMSSDEEILSADENADANMTVYTFQEPGEGRVSDGIKITLTKSVSNSEMDISIPPFVETSKGSASFAVKHLNDEEGDATITASIQTGENQTVTVSKTITFKQ